MDTPAGRQFGFYFDSDRCVQCHACEIACKSWNELEFGIRWRKVEDFWGGRFPEVSNKTISYSCMHCEKPSCRDACPAKAISKRTEDGIVVVDPGKCRGCRLCSAACLFHVPQYGRTGTMQKCHFCLERLQQGKQPSCVATCPGEALKCGPIEGLGKYSAARSVARFPAPPGPSLLISGRLSPAELTDFFASKKS